MKFPHRLILIQRVYQGTPAADDVAAGMLTENDPIETTFNGWLQPSAQARRVQETATMRDAALEADESGLAFASHLLFAPIGLLSVAHKNDLLRRDPDDGRRYQLIADPQDAAGRGHHVEVDLVEFRYAA